MLKFDTIIIGGGLSGLLCGILLSKHGQKVCILEKNPEIGGALQPFKRSGFVLDTGMNFFGAVKPGQIQYELFNIFGIIEHIHFSERKDNVFRIYLRNKEYILPAGFTNYEKKLINYFPEEGNAIQKYIKKIKDIYFKLKVEDIFDQKLDNESYHTGAFDFISSLTDNKDLLDLIVFNNMLYGGDKEAVSLYLHAVITGSYIDSVFEFDNGVTELTEFIQSSLQKKSSSIITSKKVISLNSDNDKIISCITEDGDEIFADHFISSLHPVSTLSLTDSPKIKKFYRKRIESLKNSAGAFLIYFIIKESSLEYQNEISFVLNDDNVWNSSNNSKNFILYTPHSGKQGKFSKIVKVMRLMDYSEVKKWDGFKNRKRNSEYNEFKKNIVEDSVKRINEIYPGFYDMIETFYTSSPLTFKDYTDAPFGSAYGIIRDYRNVSVNSLSVRTKIQNLYLTGQNINFHGMLGVSITAVITCSNVLKKLILN